MTKKVQKKTQKRGRKGKFTQERGERFLHAIGLGCPIKDACGYAGFSETSYFKWMTWADSDRRDAKIYADFREEVKEAEGQATAKWLQVIEEAAQGGTWQAAAWKLERRRAMFIPRTQTTVEAEINGRVTIKDARERVLEKLSELAERRGPGGSD